MTEWPELTKRLRKDLTEDEKETYDDMPEQEEGEDIDTFSQRLNEWGATKGKDIAVQEAIEKRLRNKYPQFDKIKKLLK